MQSPAWNRVWILGGTGMLRAASLGLAARAAEVTSFARTPGSLAALDAAWPADGARHNTVAVDYADEAAFAGAMDTALAARGAPDLVLAWIHGFRPALQLANRLSREARALAFVHVLGSAMSDPARSPRELWTRLEAIPHLDYRRVMLGFVIESCGSRWLTHEEISRGVLCALESGAPESLVGVVRPWSSRPARL